MRLSKLNHDEYKDIHIFISKRLNNEFKETIQNYNEFGIDNTNKSELIRLLITKLINEFNNNGDDAKFNLLKDLKNFRDEGAGE